MIHSCQFPNFLRSSNSQSLFLVACWSTSINSRSRELLHAWAVFDYGTDVYHRLLKLLQLPLPPDELMLHLEALVLLYDLSLSTERDDIGPPQRVCLVDLDHLLKGNIRIHKSQAILREMVWSSSRSILSAISPDEQDLYLRFLGPAQTAFSTLGQSPNVDVDRYFKERFQSSSGHADIYAQIRHDARSLPVPVRRASKHAEKDEDEISNHNTVSTYVSEMPLVVDLRVEHGDPAGETASSRLSWSAFLNVLGFGSCGGRKVRS